MRLASVVILLLIAVMASMTPAAVSARAEIVPGRIDPPRTPRHNAALEAGHTALFLCSGLFGSNLASEVVRRDAMLAEIDRSVLPEPFQVTVDEDAKIVSVAYLPDMPPRLAVWRPALGCSQLPIGAPVEVAAKLPRLPPGVSAPDSDRLPWPRGDAMATAEFDLTRAGSLSLVVDDAFDAGVYGGRTWGVIVLQNGSVVAERYSRGYDKHSLQRTHSAAKSIAATVIGAAVHQRIVDVYKPAAIPEWRAPGDPRAAITIDDMLRMSSGLYTEGGGNPQQEIYLAGASVAEASAGNVLDAEPGTRYVYAGSDTLLTLRALRTAIGDDDAYLRFPFEQVLWKIGMTRTLLETDWNGDFLMSGQVYASARDLARLGLLYLNGGEWEGERILPKHWPSYVSTPGPAQPDGSWASADCGSDCDGRAYGAQFFVPKAGDGLPEGTYMASGGRGQYVVVVPADRIVIVRRGIDVSKRHIDNAMDRILSRFDVEGFTRDVLSALRGQEQ